MSAIHYRDSDGTNQTPVSAATPLPVTGTVTAVTTVGTITNPVGVKGADGSTITSATNPVPVTQGAGSAATGTLANVASSATSVAVLAANTSRKGASVFNDSTAILYLKLNVAAASSSSYTVQMAAGSYYEVPSGYNGALSGIWASANGNARVTEYT